MKRIAKSILYGLISSIIGMMIWVIIGAFSSAPIAGGSWYDLGTGLIIIWFVSAIATESEKKSGAVNMWVDFIFIVVATIITIKPMKFNISFATVQEELISLKKPLIASAVLVLMFTFVSTPIVKGVEKMMNREAEDEDDSE